MTDSLIHSNGSADQARSSRSMFRIALASLVGTTIEFYDFLICGTAAALVFGPLFFPSLGPAAATVASIATFGVAFLVLKLGADRALDFRQQDFAEAVADWTDGRGVDVILDIVGGPYLKRNLASLAKGGRLLSIGYLGGEVAPQVNLLAIALKRAILTGSTMRSRTADEKAVIAADLQAKVWPALAAGRCRPIIHEVFPLTRAADAHRMMESGKHVGKIVLDATA